MRLRLIKKILEATTNELHISEQVVGGVNSMKISGLLSTLNAVRQIEKTGVLKQEVQQILSSDISLTSSDSLVVDGTTCHSFSNSIKILRERSNALFHALRDLMQDDFQEIVSFRLPESIQLDELTDLLQDLKRSLEQSLVNQYVNGEISLQGFDRGTAWIEIGLGSMLAVQVLGGMVKLIHDILEMRKKHEIHERTLQDLDLQLDLKTQVVETSKKQLDSFVSQEVNHLIREVGAQEDNHELGERFKYTIETLSKWMDRGLEVHPSLTSTPETQRLFPDAERILEAMKLLPSGIDE
jgi:hypothetical protein